MRKRRFFVAVSTVTLLLAPGAFGEPPAGSAAAPAGSATPHGGPPGRARPGERPRHPGPDREHGPDRDGGGPPGRAGGRHFRAMQDDLRERFRAEKPDKEELKKKIAEWHEARDDRRRDHRARLMSRWGKTLAKADVNDELRLHARRTARLARMEEVAATEKAGDARAKLLERIEKLRKAEDERHKRAMERLASGAAPVASGAAAGSAAPATPPAAPSAAPTPAASAGGTP